MLLRKGFPTARLRIKTDTSAPSFRPNFPACVCRTPCSLQHPKIGLFQLGHLQQLPSCAKVSADNTAGTLAPGWSRHRCHHRKPRGRASLLPLSLRNLPANTCLPRTVPTQGLTLTEKGRQVFVVPQKHPATNRIRRIQEEAAHQTFDDFVNKKSFFFLGTWAWGAAVARALRDPCPHTLPPEWPWQAQQVAFSNRHTLSYLICFSPT